MITRAVITSLLTLLALNAAADPAYHRPGDADIRQKLTPMQYEVTQEQGTEPAYNNAYWNNKEAGIYVDIVTGEPLFLSTDKYDSGTGWPSFTKPIDANDIVLTKDHSLLETRIEVSSKIGRTHLGHVFDDGPAPTGKRYCMNSASLEFIPVKDMKKRGYGKYLKYFNTPSTTKERE